MRVDIQDLDKKDAVAEKQRESMMVGLSKTKSELGSLQDALAKTQVELEKTNFELHAKKSKHMSSVQVYCHACTNIMPLTADVIMSADDATEGALLHRFCDVKSMVLVNHAVSGWAMSHVTACEVCSQCMLYHKGFRACCKPSPTLCRRV